VVVDGAVHILKSSPAESRVALYRLAGTALELVSDVAAPAPSGRPVAGPDRVVWTTASQIVALQPSTGEVRVVADASGEIDLAAGASHLYWTHRAAGEVRRYSYTTGEVELFAAGQPGAMRVFAGDSRVVWYNADSANLVSLPLSPP
jgi:hypothetical protein